MSEDHPSVWATFFGLDELLEDLDKMPERSNDIIPRTMNRTADEMWQHAHDNVPVRKGVLQSSLYATVEGLDRIELGATAPWGGYVENGTEPHIITPRFSRVLRFEIGGQTVYTRLVNHPGTRPQPFIEPAVEYGSERIKDIYSEELDSWLLRRGWT